MHQAGVFLPLRVAGVGLLKITRLNLWVSPSPPSEGLCMREFGVHLQPLCLLVRTGHQIRVNFSGTPWSCMRKCHHVIKPLVAVSHAFDHHQLFKLGAMTIVFGRGLSLAHLFPAFGQRIASQRAADLTHDKRSLPEESLPERHEVRAGTEGLGNLGPQPEIITDVFRMSGPSTCAIGSTRPPCSWHA